MFWSNPNYFYQDTINEIFISTRLLKNYNIWLHYCKTLQYLLYKTNIENRSPHIFFQKYAASELRISARDWWHPSLSQMVLRVNHWSFSLINHMSTKTSQPAWLECIWVPVSARLSLTKIPPDYLMYISIDSFLSLISYKLCFEKLRKKKRGETVYISKTFAASCFWLKWFVSGLLLVTLLLTSYGSHQF